MALQVRAQNGKNGEDGFACVGGMTRDMQKEEQKKRERDERRESPVGRVLLIRLRTN